MTRINVVPVQELCDQHLLAEHRELTRIPNNILRGRFDLKGQPQDYQLGTGHVKFFYNKLAFLKRRYDDLHAECLRRGFRVQYIWPELLMENVAQYSMLWQDYFPTPQALSLNRERIALRMPQKARFTAAT